MLMLVLSLILFPTLTHAAAPQLCQHPYANQCTQRARSERYEPDAPRGCNCDREEIARTAIASGANRGLRGRVVPGPIICLIEGCDDDVSLRDRGEEPRRMSLRWGPSRATE